MAKRTENNKDLVLQKNSVWNFLEGSMNVFKIIRHHLRVCGEKKEPTGLDDVIRTSIFS